MERENQLEINGMLFDTPEEAGKASMELKKIQYLESKIDYADTRKVQAIYEKAVRENIFQTPVGLFYLKGIRDFLTREDVRYEEVLPAVPVKSLIGGATKEKDEGTPAKTKTAEKKREERRKKELQDKGQKLYLSILINCVLAIAVIVMFWIAMQSEQPNILNYEKALKNRYASWEQELTEREKELRARELEIYREESER